MVQEERAIITTNLLETISSFRPLVSFQVAGGSFSVFGGSCRGPVWGVGAAKRAWKSLKARGTGWGAQSMEGSIASSIQQHGSYEHKASLLAVTAAHSRRHELRHQSLFVCWADGNVWLLCGFLLTVWTEIALVFIASRINISQSCPLSRAKTLYSVLTTRT